jgi:hypothetical protein
LLSTCGDNHSRPTHPASPTYPTNPTNPTYLSHLSGSTHHSHSTRPTHLPHPTRSMYMLTLCISPAPLILLTNTTIATDTPFTADCADTVATLLLHCSFVTLWLHLNHTVATQSVGGSGSNAAYLREYMAPVPVR